MTLTHYVTAVIDCMGGTCFVCFWSGATISFWESVSAASSYICLGRARTYILCLDTIAVVLVANKHNVLRGSIQVSKPPPPPPPPSEDMAAICPRMLLFMYICNFYK